MKNMKKIFALLIAMVMVFGISTSVFAAKTVASGNGGSASITITLPTDENTNNEYTYKVYKVFDATSDGSSSIAYQLMSGKTDVPAVNTFVKDDSGYVYHFSGTYATATTEGAIAITVGGTTKYIVPTGGTLTSDEVDAIKAYVGSAEPVITGTAKVSDGTLVFTELKYGYYYITTTTGTVVTIDSTNPNASVRDKNAIPTLDKKITGELKLDEAGQAAVAQIGKDVPFEVTIHAKKGAINYVFNDTMTNMFYNKDISIKYDGTEVATSNYTKTETNNSIKIEFGDDYIHNLTKNLEEGALADIVITYSAKVNADGLSVDSIKNTASLDYGNGDNTTSTPDKETKVYNATIIVDKQDGSNNNAPLAGVGFKLKNSEGKYYKYTAATDSAAAKVEWVDKEQGDEVTTVVDNGKATASFPGLQEGTYTLVETTTPNGYTVAADVEVVINKNEFTNASISKTQVIKNYKGTELPSTGGMGTTLFYVFGIILVLGGSIFLVSRRRMVK